MCIDGYCFHCHFPGMEKEAGLQSKCPVYNGLNVGPNLLQPNQSNQGPTINCQWYLFITGKFYKVTSLELSILADRKS